MGVYINVYMYMRARSRVHDPKVLHSSILSSSDSKLLTSTCISAVLAYHRRKYLHIDQIKTSLKILLEILIDCDILGLSLPSYLLLSRALGFD